MAAFLRLKCEERLQLIHSICVDLKEIVSLSSEVNKLETDHADQSLLGLKSLLNATNASDQGREAVVVPDEINCDILKEISIPFLKKSVAMQLKINSRVLSEISVLCFPSASSTIQSDIMTVVVNALSAYTTERGITHFKDECVIAEGVFVAVDFASRMFQDLPCCKILEKTSIPALLFNEIIKMMLLAEDKVAGQILGTLCQVLPREKSGNGRDSQLEAVWSVIRAIFENDGQKTFQSKEYSEMSERPSLILCGMADWFFPVDGLPQSSIEILSQPYFWQLLQSGFFHANALTRKRTMYLLKRILDVIETNEQEVTACDVDLGQPVFWWSKSEKIILSKTWEDFILLVETLEEKQVHVVKPIMPRLQSLVAACSLQVDGNPLLHTSWLTTVLQRVGGHESAHINRWGVIETLNIEYSVCPMFEQNQKAFLCGPFMTMLSQASVYYKPSDTSLGVSPPVAQALLKFFETCITTLPKETAEEFFSAFFKALKNEFWSGAALVYITYGLSQASPNLIFNASIVNDIRDLITSCLANLETHFRGAALGFLTKTIIKQANPEQVGPDVFMVYLAALKLGESYTRGTTLWKDIVEWMQRLSAEYNNWSPLCVANLINVCIQNWLVPPKDGGDSISGQGDQHVVDKCEGVVRFLILAEDAGLLKKAEDNLTFEGQVTSIVNVIALFNGYVYASPIKAHKALEYLMHLLKEVAMFQVSAATDVLSAAVYKIVAERKEEIILFIHRRAEQLEQLDEAEYLDLYVNVLNTLLEIEPVNLKSLPIMKSIVDCCIAKLNTKIETKPTTKDQLQCYSSMALLSTICNHLHCLSSENKSKCLEEYQWVASVLDFVVVYQPKCKFDKPCDLTAVENHSEVTPTWGKICSEYLAWQWQCLQLADLLGDRSPFLAGEERALGFVDDCLTAMDLVSNQPLAPFFSCLGQLLPLVEEVKAAETLEISFRKVLEDPRNVYFWESFDAYLELSFRPIFLEHPAESKIHEQLQKCAMKLLELGEEKQGYANMVIHVIIRWMRSSEAAMAKGVNYINILVKGLLFGPVHSRGRRFVLEVLQYVIGLGDTVSVNQVRKSELLRTSDCQVRVQVLRYLASLKPSNSQHAQLAWTLFEALVEEQKEVLRITTYRNFPNSSSHRLKHRIFSALLILDSFVTQERVGFVFGFLIDMLMKESQPSIRCMIEWMIVRLVHRYHPLRNDIWYLIKQSSEKKAAFLCSLLAISSQLSKLLSNKSEEEIFVMEALPRILPWCMTHHFNVRVYAQAALFTFWKMAKNHKLKAVLLKHSLVESFMTFCQDNEQASKNTFKLLDNFLFDFEPIKDYSIETIVKTLPYLTELTDEEWIKPELFEADGEKWKTVCGRDAVPLYNPTDTLRHCKVGTWRVRIETNPGEDDEVFQEGDVQKKMIPWRMMLPQKELELDFQDDYAQKKFTVPSGGLVLVTSLIDKIPNLGGLCRTCEIFGVSEFVIRNIKYTSDRSFESLSVTAHKWLPIKEVKPQFLKEYMLEMKEQGYTLVGAEQTANSHSLTTYKFPKKTLLLLGNEKEGIPVDLIQLLDVCVEIPQQGIIRSLNVHVSGALLIWEYTRQQLHPQGNNTGK